VWQTLLFEIWLCPSPAHSPIHDISSANPHTLKRRHETAFLSANESRYGAGYWDAFRQAADELEAVLDGREIPPANRDLPLNRSYRP
jgi:hypothetical protein